MIHVKIIHRILGVLLLIESGILLLCALLPVFYGADVTQEDAEAVGASLTDALPEAEVSVVDGGQPVYFYMISAEA